MSLGQGLDSGPHPHPMTGAEHSASQSRQFGSWHLSERPYDTKFIDA